MIKVDNSIIRRVNIYSILVLNLTQLIIIIFIYIFFRQIILLQIEIIKI